MRGHSGYYRTLFRAAAIWSWAVALAFFLGDTFNEPFLRRMMSRVEPRVVLDMAVLPTFLFGFAFWSLSRDWTKNLAIVWVGAAGSILTFVSFATRALMGDVPPLLVSAAVVDLVFGILFVNFLMTEGRKSAN